MLANLLSCLKFQTPLFFVWYFFFEKKTASIDKNLRMLKVVYFNQKNYKSFTKK